MAGALREPARCARRGLTMPELLIGIALVGTAGALLLPHLIPHSRPEAAVTQSRVPSSLERSLAAQQFLVGLAALPEDELSGRGFIGIRIADESTADGYAQVRLPFPGSPAFHAGLRPNDVILRVDGLTTRKKSVEQVVKMITKGRPGTVVRLSIRRTSAADVLQIRITRGSFLSVFLPGIA